MAVCPHHGNGDFHRKCTRAVQKRNPATRASVSRAPRPDTLRTARGRVTRSRDLQSFVCTQVPSLLSLAFRSKALL